MAENITNNAAWEQAKCLPRHIAIILDGNGRWAKKRLLPRNAGHLAGSETFRNIATYCKEIGIEYLTVYAFSTENWKRPEEEVGGIMKLLDKYLHEAIRDMRKKNIRMKVFGDVTALSPELQALGLSGKYLHKLRRQSGDSARRTGLCRGLCRRKSHR